MNIYVCEKCKEFYIDNIDNYMYLVPREYLKVNIVGVDCQEEEHLLCDFSEHNFYGHRFREIIKLMRTFNCKNLIQIITKLLDLNLEKEVFDYGMYYNSIYSKWIENGIEPALYGLYETITNKELAFYLICKYNLDINKLRTIYNMVMKEKSIKNACKNKYIFSKKKSAKEVELNDILGIEEFIEMENNTKTVEKIDFKNNKNLVFVELPDYVYNLKFARKIFKRVKVYKIQKEGRYYYLLVNKVNIKENNSNESKENKITVEKIKTDNKNYGIFGRKIKDGIDFYATPREAVEALLKVESFNGLIYEPCSGAGAISKILEENNYYVVSSDIREDENVYGIKKSDIFKINEYKIDNIITNPPYQFAKECILKSLEIANKKVAMLLPITFLASEKRYNFFKETPLKKVYVFANRITMYPEFYTEKIKNGGMKTYAWFVWEKGYKGIPQIDLITTSNKKISKIKPKEIVYQEIPTYVYKKLAENNININEIIFPKNDCILHALIENLKNKEKFALLGKLSFMESLQRYRYLKNNPYWKETLIFSKRIKFDRKGKSNPVDYALYVFDKTNVKEINKRNTKLKWII